MFKIFGWVSSCLYSYSRQSLSLRLQDLASRRPCSASKSLPAPFLSLQVSPVGLRTALPIVVAAEIAELPFMWLGGGEPDLKLRVSVPAFLAAYKPAVVACSDPKRTVEDT